MKIDRFDPEINCQYGLMELSPDGDYVRYEDFVKLLVDYQSLSEEVSLLRTLLEIDPKDKPNENLRR